jgi:succinyl-diaminopimelate desuccinylase
MADLLALTAQLVDMPSISFEERPFVDWLEAELTGLDHLTVTRIGDNLVARTELGRSRRLLLVGHTDTVAANDNATARIDGDTLWGLGSTDMKGGLAVFLHLARTVPDPALDLSFVFYAREEVAQQHNGLNELIAEAPHLLHGDCAIVGEPTGAVIEAGCQGAMRFELTLTGARAHTARPWMGRNAIHRLAPVLEALANHQVRTPVIDGCAYRESVQAVTIHGGVAGNVIPDEVTLAIHYRYAPDRTGDEAHAHMRDMLAPFADTDLSSGNGDNGDRLMVVDHSPACAPSLGHPLLERLIRDNDLEVRAKLGWTDVARFDQLGVPATNFGPGDPTLAHAADERLERQSLETVHRALHRLITEPSDPDAEGR